MRARLPIEYRLKDAKREALNAAAEIKARKMFREYDSYTIDIVMIANALALIEGEGWGTGKNAKKINRHVARVRKTIDDACERYGHDCAMTALKKRLREYGVEFEMRSET
jgi:hypothetical protein